MLPFIKSIKNGENIGEDAFQDLVAIFSSIIWREATHYARKGKDINGSFEELRSVGINALAKAMEDYKPDGHKTTFFFYTQNRTKDEVRAAYKSEMGYLRNEGRIIPFSSLSNGSGEKEEKPFEESLVGTKNHIEDALDALLLRERLKVLTPLERSRYIRYLKLKDRHGGGAVKKIAEEDGKRPITIYKSIEKAQKN